MKFSLLFRLARLAPLPVAVLLFIGPAGLVVSSPGLGLRNWLVVMFEINAGMGGLPPDVLRLHNPLDVFLLILVGLTFLGLWDVLVRANRVLALVAVALPFAGAVVLLTTHLAGRSSIMAAGLVVAFLMLGDGACRRLGYLGILANAFLLVGDFATDESSSANWAVAVPFAVGYGILTLWFFLIGTGNCRGFLKGGAGHEK